MADKQRRLPLLPALKNYMSLNRRRCNAGRISDDEHRQSDGRRAACLNRTGSHDGAVCHPKRRRRDARTYSAPFGRNAGRLVICRRHAAPHIPEKHAEASCAGTNAGKLSDYS